jgi:hypothetical protein
MSVRIVKDIAAHLPPVHLFSTSPPTLQRERAAGGAEARRQISTPKNSSEVVDTDSEDTKKTRMYLDELLKDWSTLDVKADTGLGAVDDDASAKDRREDPVALEWDEDWVQAGKARTPATALADGASKRAGAPRGAGVAEATSDVEEAQPSIEVNSVEAVDVFDSGAGDENDMAWDNLVPRDDSRIITIEEIIPRERTKSTNNDPSGRARTASLSRGTPAEKEPEAPRDIVADFAHSPRSGRHHERRRAGHVHRPVPQALVAAEDEPHGEAQQAGLVSPRSPVPENEADRRELLMNMHMKRNFTRLEGDPESRHSPSHLRGTETAPRATSSPKLPANGQHQRPMSSSSGSSTRSIHPSPGSHEKQFSPATAGSSLRSRSALTPELEGLGVFDAHSFCTKPDSTQSLSRLMTRVRSMRPEQFQRLEHAFQRTIGSIAGNLS